MLEHVWRVPVASTRRSVDEHMSDPPRESGPIRGLSKSVREAFRGGVGAQRRSSVTRYGAATLMTLVAWGLALLLGSELSVRTHLPFAAAVALATWFGGAGPGLLSALLSVLAIDFSFLPPFHSIELTHIEELVDSVMFLIVASTIGMTTATLRRAWEVAEQRASDLERANAHLARLAGQAQRLLDVTSALAEASSVDEVVEVMLTKGTRAVEAQRAFVMLVDGGHVERLGATGYGDEMSRRSRLPSLDEDGAVAEAVRTREPIWLSDAAEFSKRYPRVFARVGAVSDHQTHVIAPLTNGSEAIGALGMSFAEPSAAGAADRTFTLLLAQALAAALQRARSFDAEREKRREAELTARTREQVLGVVAHDLRNPLHLVMATTEMLNESDLTSERRRELLAMTARAVTHMRRLVSDLLDAVRIQAGHLTLDVEELTIGAIIDQAEEMNRPMARERGIEFAVRALERDRTVRVDRGRIQQVLGNLLGNAFKFTERGGRVTLEAAVVGNMALFRVRDTGSGIPADRLPHLFDQFWQGKDSDSRGVGLGLAIVKAIVEAHGGTIAVESAEGEGSTFTLKLPLHNETWVRESTSDRADRRIPSLAE